MMLVVLLCRKFIVLFGSFTSSLYIFHNGHIFFFNNIFRPTKHYTIYVTELDNLSSSDVINAQIFCKANSKLDILKRDSKSPNYDGAFYFDKFFIYLSAD